MDYGLKEMNEIHCGLKEINETDYGLEEKRWNMITEVNTVP